MNKVTRPRNRVARRSIQVCLGALCLVVALNVSASSGRLTGILGMDDRIALDSDSWPWSAIGRVYLPTGGFCTGAVIGSRHVLTAAHCLYDHRHLAWFTAGELAFVPGDGDDDPSRQVVGTQVIFAIDEAQYRDVAIEQPTLNWAILVVAEDLAIQAIPWRVVGPARLQDSLEDGKATLVRAGYSEDSADRLSAHFGCNVSGISQLNGMMLHGCDATSGDAGSPLLLIQPGGAADLLAINVAVQHEADNSVGVAVPASAFDEAARNAVLQGASRTATH